MTDSYIKQVAEAVRDVTLVKAWQIGNGPLRSTVDLDEVIDCVSKPDPFGFIHQSNGSWKKHCSEMTVKITRRSQPDCEFTFPIYAYPPEAEVEIDRLTDKCGELQKQIDSLTSRRHGELTLAVELGWKESGQGWNSEFCQLPDNAQAERVAIVKMIEEKDNSDV
jgi:hypothetical protein